MFHSTLLTCLILKVETRSSSSVTLSLSTIIVLIFKKSLIAHFVMHLLDFGKNFLPHSVNLGLILIILFLALLNRIVYAHLSHHHYCHCPSLLLFSTLNSKDTFSLNPSRHRPHPFHRTAFTDTGLLNGSLFSFSINLLVWFVQ